MTESCDKNTRYRLWAQLKEALNGKNMERLARTVRRLFERVIICRHSLQKAEDEVRIIESSGVKVIEQLDGRSFRYPKDRYLTNAEIHTQLMLLEKRFKEQTEVLRNHERKEEDKKSGNGRKASTKPSVETEERFDRMSEMVEKIKLRRYITESGLDGFDVLE